MAQPKPTSRRPARNPRQLTVAIHAQDLKSLREIVRTHRLDYGCRPHALLDAKSAYYTTAVVSADEREHLRRIGLDVRDLFDQTSDDRSANATVGKGDRFKGGEVPPQGAGSRPDARDDDLGPI